MTFSGVKSQTVPVSFIPFPVGSNACFCYTWPILWPFASMRTNTLSSYELIIQSFIDVKDFHLY